MIFPLRIVNSESDVHSDILFYEVGSSTIRDYDLRIAVTQGLLSVTVFTAVAW
jgi:hypothetical protein